MFKKIYAMVLSSTDIAMVPQNQSAVTKAIARHNIRKIKGKFSKLVTKSRKSLQRRIDIKDAQTFLVTMYSSPNSRDGSDTVTTVVKSAKSVDEIILALSENGLWDYLNYDLLQDIIEEFASDDDELNAMMEQYQRDLTGHVLTLQIQTYLEATHNKHPIATSDSENSGDEIISALLPQQKRKFFNELSLKIDANVTDCTLGYIKGLWQSLANQFRLPRPAMILHSIAEGCICITWLIPTNLATHVTRMVRETSDMFAKQHILRVKLEEQCIYPMETETLETKTMEIKHTMLDELSLPEIKPSLPEIKPSLLEPELPPETEHPSPETNPPLPLTEPLPPLTESLPPLTESLPPLTESLPPPTEPLPPLTELPPPETESSQPETKPPPPETEPSLLEPRPLPIESEMVAPKRKVCYIGVSMQTGSLVSRKSIHMCGVYFRRG